MTSVDPTIEVWKDGVLSEVSFFSYEVLGTLRFTFEQTTDTSLVGNYQMLISVQNERSERISHPNYVTLTFEVIDDCYKTVFVDPILDQDVVFELESEESQQIV